jgi:Ca2+/Na+ antiporter
VLAPIASNASEIIASYSYAQKKTVASMAISLAALQGACCMNNTFVLGIFMLLVYLQDLSWEFFAETVSNAY